MLDKSDCLSGASGDALRREDIAELTGADLLNLDPAPGDQAVQDDIDAAQGQVGLLRQLTLTDDIILVDLTQD